MKQLALFIVFFMDFLVFTVFVFHFPLSDSSNAPLLHKTRSDKDFLLNDDSSAVVVANAVAPISNDEAPWRLFFTTPASLTLLLASFTNVLPLYLLCIRTLYVYCVFESYVLFAMFGILFDSCVCL